MTMMSFDDLEGDLNEGGKAHADKPGTTEWSNPCPKCQGTGRFRHLGPCFMCKGTGKLTFKTSPEQRARANQQAHQRKADKLGTAKDVWTAAHPAEMAWCQKAAARGFSFAQAMVEAVGKYGGLTDRQLAAVQRFILQDAERDQVRAVAVEQAHGIDVSRITALFASARKATLKRPKLRVGDIELALAAETSKNPGAVYVRRGDDYLGKIVAGFFEPSYRAKQEDIELVKATAAEPLALAVAYGRRTGNCACCGRQLTDPVSVANGIGPICQSKWGM